MHLKMAWRNMWRNKRRTFITMGAILFSVVLAVIMSSFQKGTWDQIIGSVIEQYSGYGQIHKKGYWDEQILNNAMPLISKDSIQPTPKNLKNLIPRLEAFALGSYKNSSQGAQVVGVDPALEDSLTGLSKKLVRGEYLKKDEPGILLSEGYARIMGMDVGDTLILLGQGYHGITAVGLYNVVGIVNFGSPELNNRITFLPLKEAQYTFGMPGLVTSMVFQFESHYDFEKTISEIRSNIDTSRYEVMNWKEMNPSLVQAVQADTGGMVIMLAIIYIVIAFGIFSTVLMMTAERVKEFGILLSIGMKRWRMQLMMFYETMLLAIIGILAGLVAALPVMSYFGQHPIQLSGEMAKMYEDYGFEAVVAFSTNPQIFINQAMIIMVVVILIFIYPWNQLRKLDPVTSRL